MISFVIALLLAVAACASLSAIHRSMRAGFAAARLIGLQLAALDTPTPAVRRARPVRVAALRRPARPALGLRAAA